MVVGVAPKGKTNQRIWRVIDGSGRAIFGKEAIELLEQNQTLGMK
jgi:hypothetical protein